MKTADWGVRASQAWIAVVFAGCGQAKPPPVAPPPSPTPISVTGPTKAEVDAGPPEASASMQPEPDAGAADAPVVSAQASACPNGMILVDTSYCPRIDRKCIDEEYSPQNKITICHKFATSQRCLGEHEHR